MTPSFQLHAALALLPAGWASDVWVAVDAGGRIQEVTREPPPSSPAPNRVDVLLPALCNLHSHSFQRAIAGRTERRGPQGLDSFWTWRETMYRALGDLGPEEVESLAQVAFREMLESGYAAVGEFHYLHHGREGRRYDILHETSARIVSAANHVGIGLTLLPVHYAQGGCDGRPLQGGQHRFHTDLDEFGRLMEGAARALHGVGMADAGLGIAPHSLRAVPPEHLTALATAFRDTPTHIHAAEQLAEVEEVEAYLGARPVRWLLDHAPVGREWCVIHATHLDDGECADLARSGAVAGLCPVTEANLGDGIFRAADYAERGGAWGIGTDSNVRISLTDELRTLEYGQRLRDGRRVILADGDRSCGRWLYEQAAAGGARALGRDSGSITPGRWADLVTLDRARLGAVTDPSALDGDAVLDLWMFSARTNPVTDVWSAGRHVVREGQATRVAGPGRRFRWAE